MGSLSSHWGEVLVAVGSAGGIGASIRYFPNFWRGLIRIIASPILLGIEREVRLAREEQVADLLEEIERLKRDRESSDG